MATPGVHCVHCGLKMTKVESGVVVEELRERGTEPYCLWHADLHRCSGCDTEIIAGFALRPFRHYSTEPDQYTKDKNTATYNGRLYSWSN